MEPAPFRARWRRTLQACWLALSLGSAALPCQAVVGSLPADLRSTAWTADDGRAFQLSQLRAPWVVMTMSYTACRRTCSATSVVLQEIEKRLAEMGQPAEFVVVSYDPDNDSPAAWAEYRRKRSLTHANWHFLSGSAPATRRLARLLDLDYWSYHGHIVHDFRIVLFDAQWRLVLDLPWDQVDRLPVLLGAALR